MKLCNYFLLTVAAVFLFDVITCAQTLPIKPVRTVSFMTNEGTYMNVDVSPDGKTLAFDLLGDLYTVSAIGGIAKQLTRGMALHARPVWSPDGKRLAYISDESGAPNLNVMDLKSIFHEVLGNWQCPAVISTENDNVYGFDAVWTPDGHYVVLSDKAYGLDGKQLSSPFAVSQPLRFSEARTTAYGIDSGRLYRYDLREMTSMPISDKLDKYLAGTISPDGRWWCYIADIGGTGDNDRNGRRKLIALDLTRNVSHTLVESLIVIDPRLKPVPPAIPPPHFSFSPDSKMVYIGYGGKIHRIAVTSGVDKIIPFQANVNVDMGAYNYHTYPVSLNPFNVKYARSASASPDGKHLVFTALSRLYIMDLPNGKPYVLCPQSFGQFQPTWSPDGKAIAYTSWCDTTGGFLWKVSASGGKPERLTKVAGLYQRPVWSPNGKHLAVIRGEPKLMSNTSDGNGLLELLQLGGLVTQSVADSIPSKNNIITFSADGRQLLYSPKHGSNSSFFPQLVAQNIASHGIKTIANGFDITGISQIAASPDGRYLVYSADEDLYLVALSSLSNPVTLSRFGNLLAGIRFAAGVDPAWENGGKILSWTYANIFYRINPDKVIATAERANALRNPKDTIPGSPMTISIKPDQTISLDVTTFSNYAKGLIALRGERILTMQGQKVIEKGTILINNGRIAALGPVATIPIPKGAKIFDLTGKTIMPGLIDLHLHFHAISESILPQQLWMFLASLAYGVTTARDPAKDFDSFGYAELIRSGQMLGPRFYTVGAAVRFPDGVMRFDNPADADAVVRKRFLLGGSEIKQYLLPTRIQREWLIQACEKYGMNMTNEGGTNPVYQLGMIKDGTTGIEHNPVWGDTYGDVITLRAKALSYLTPTLQVAYDGANAKSYFKYEYWHYPDAKWMRFVYGAEPVNWWGAKIDSNGKVVFNPPTEDTIHPAYLTKSTIDARIRHAGGSIVLGGHGDDQGIATHNELWALQAGGLTNMEALQEATIDCAKALGIQKDIGSLEMGKIADLLILDKNPLEDIHNSREIRYVMQSGILYDANTLDEIWPIKKKCPEWKIKNTEIFNK